MRAMLLRAAACAAMALLLPPRARADQTYFVQVEILPPDDAGDDSAAAVASRLASAVADTNSALHDSEYLAFLLRRAACMG